MRDRLVVVAHPDVPRPTDNSAVPAVVRGPGERIENWRMKAAAAADAAADSTLLPGTSSIVAEPVLRLASHFMVRDAVRLGVGAARLPLSLVIHDLAAGTLLAWGDVDGPEIALWALYPSRRLLSARVSAFLGYLREAFPKGTPDELASWVAAG